MAEPRDELRSGLPEAYQILPGWQTRPHFN